jgi:hypothetical protein
MLFTWGLTDDIIPALADLIDRGIAAGRVYGENHIVADRHRVGQFLSIESKLSLDPASDDLAIGFADLVPTSCSSYYRSLGRTLHVMKVQL